MGADITTIRPTNIFAKAKAHPTHASTSSMRGRRSRWTRASSAAAASSIYLNGCWSHLLAPQLTKQAYDWWLDMLPINRVMAWGGDYWWAVENVYGVVMTVRGFSPRCWRRGSGRRFRRRRGRCRSRSWMHDNPREVKLISDGDHCREVRRDDSHARRHSRRGARLCRCRHTAA